MSATRYVGPERREDGDAAILARLDAIQAHFDMRMTALEAKVEPMHEYIVTARTGATIIRWLVLVGAPIIGVWATIKGWFIGRL